MSYVVNNHLNNLYVLSNKAIGPGKNPKLINVGPTSIPEARVSQKIRSLFRVLEMYDFACILETVNEYFGRQI